MPTLQVNIKPFAIPQSVSVDLPGRPPGHRRGEHFDARTVPLTSLAPETLSALCDEFRKSVFEVAKQQDPKANAP